MASRYDIFLEKPIPEVIYTEPKDFWKTGAKIFSDCEPISGKGHRCWFKRTYVTQEGEGFICACGMRWNFMNFSTLKEWEKKTEILNKKKEERIKKGFASDDILLVSKE